MTLQKNGEHKSWLSQLNKSADRTFLAVFWKFFCVVAVDGPKYFHCDWISSSRVCVFLLQIRQNRRTMARKAALLGWKACLLFTMHNTLYVVGPVVQSHSSLSISLPFFYPLSHRRIQFKRKYFPNRLFSAIQAVKFFDNDCVCFARGWMWMARARWAWDGAASSLNHFSLMTGRAHTQHTTEQQHTAWKCGSFSKLFFNILARSLRSLGGPKNMKND